MRRPQGPAQFRRRGAAIRERFDLTPRRQSQAFAGAATLALASLAPCLAHAQQSSGPVTVGGASQPLTIGIQERTTYYTNVARGTDQAATIRGLEEEESESSGATGASLAPVLRGEGRGEGQTNVPTQANRAAAADLPSPTKGKPAPNLTGGPTAASNPTGSS